MLRRLPVGASSSLFSYNELPSNLQRRVPYAALEHLAEGERRSRRAAPAAQREAAHQAAPLIYCENGAACEAKATGGGSVTTADDLDATRLLVLHEPQFTPSQATMFAFFRRAAKERCVIRRQHEEGQESSDDALRYLRCLEEPCLLLPDTRHSGIALGLTVNRNTALSSSRFPRPALAEAQVDADTAAAQLDGFHLGLVTESTDYRVDYSAQPTSYVLGVPTALLALLTPTDTTTTTGVAAAVDVSRATTTTATAVETHREHGPHRREQQMGSMRASVDLSRWVVYDGVSSQFLLRRRGVEGDAPTATTTTAAAGADVAAATSRACGKARTARQTYLSLLEEQVFLVHTYSFDPRNAYEAAVAAACHGTPLLNDDAREPAATKARGLLQGTGVESASSGYTLFFFHFARDKDRPFFAHARNLDMLYPSCFHSYTCEVPTTHMLAADGAGTPAAAQLHTASAPTQAQEMLADSPSPHAATPFFIPCSSKRFHLVVSATGRGGGGGGPPFATSWTTQADQHARHTVQHADSLSETGDGERARAVVATAASVHGDDADAESAFHTTPEQLRKQIGAAFREWGGMVAARAVATAAVAAQQNETIVNVQDAHANSLAGGDGDGATQPSRFVNSFCANAGEEATSWEARLDAERLALVSHGHGSDAALARVWNHGWRLTPAPIVVAVPIFYVFEESPPLPGASTKEGAKESGRDTAARAGVTNELDCSVADAPLATAVWQALYTPEEEGILNSDLLHADAPSSFPARKEAVSKLFAHRRGLGDFTVLPLAEDRLSTARYRVLLPFLCKPRRVLPSAAHLTSPTCTDDKAAPAEPRVKGLPSPSKSSSVTGGMAACGPSQQQLQRRQQRRCCPALWHVDEVEKVCGWRRFRSQLLDPFGSFSALLNHDAYVAFGRQVPAFSTPSPSLSREADAAGWSSPVIWINDEAYVCRVLAPAMVVFAAHTTRLLKKNGLYLYRGLLATQAELTTGQRRDPQVPAAFGSPDAAQSSPPSSPSTRDRFPLPAKNSFDEAVAVGVHHRLLVRSLQRLQQVPHPQLCEWLAAACGNDDDDSLPTQVVAHRTGLSAACLSFFKNAAVMAAAAEAEAEARGTDHDVASATLPASQLAKDQATALRSLGPENIHVVPLLDFLTWASLCSDFAEASLDELRCRAAAVRQVFTVQDCVMAAKYCAQNLAHLCLEGGCGSTVAVMTIHTGRT